MQTVKLKSLTAGWNIICNTDNMPILQGYNIEILKPKSAKLKGYISDATYFLDMQKIRYKKVSRFFRYVFIDGQYLGVLHQRMLLADVLYKFQKHPYFPRVLNQEKNSRISNTGVDRTDKVPQPKTRPVYKISGIYEVGISSLTGKPIRKYNRKKI